MASVLLWLISSIVLLAAGALGLILMRRGRRLPTAAIAGAIGVATAGSAAGLVVRAAAYGTWPGVAAADALALLALGGLMGEIWQLRRRTEAYAATLPACCLSLAMSGLLLVGAGWLADQVPAAVPQAASALFAARNVLAGLGLGAWIPALAGTFAWTLRGAFATPAELLDPALPPRLHGMTGRAGDPGRAVALAGYPLLTAAWLLGGAWSVLSYATPWRAVPGELWLAAAWAFGAAYFHATSGWRPLRVARWAVLLLATAVVVSAVAAALSAASLGAT